MTMTKDTILKQEQDNQLHQQPNDEIEFSDA
jgi:hypothetical protein